MLKILSSMSEFRETRKHRTQGGEKKNWVEPYYGCSLSPGGKATHISFALHCHWDKKLIYSNLYLSDPHEEDKMTVDGVMKFLEELQLNPESLTVLILAWRFKAATQCEFTKDEFVNGMMEMWCVSSVQRFFQEVLTVIYGP